MVYDITDKETFESLRSWLDDIENCATDEMRVMLVGNKLDLDDKRDVTYK